MPPRELQGGRRHGLVSFTVVACSISCVGHRIVTGHLNVTVRAVRLVDCCQFFCPSLALPASHSYTARSRCCLEFQSLLDLQHVLVQLLEVLGLQVVIHQLGDGTVARAFVGVAADSSLGLQTVTVCFECSAEVLVNSH